MIRVILRKYLIQRPEAITSANLLWAKRGRAALSKRRARNRTLRKMREHRRTLKLAEQNREKMALKREIKRLNEIKAMEEKVEQAIIQTQQESRLPPPDSVSAAWVTRLWKAKNG